MENIGTHLLLSVVAYFITINMDISEINQTAVNITGSWGNRSSALDNADFKFLQYLWMFITPTLFAVIIVIGSLGNILVIFVIVQNNMMRNINNILLFNLALADMTFLWTCLPFQAYKFAAFDFPLGDIICKLVQYSLYVSAYVTVWTLVAIAGLRYLSIVKAHRSSHLRTRPNVICICIGIWVVFLATNIPVLLSHRVNNYGIFQYCGLVPESVSSVLTTFFVFAYVMPLAIIAVFYILISHFLCCHSGSTSERTLRKTRRRHTKRAIRTVSVVVLVFAISWLPFHINSLLSVYNLLPSSKFYEICRVLWYCMAYGNSLANPIVYGITSEEYKKAFQAKCDLWCCCCYNSGSRFCNGVSRLGSYYSSKTRTSTSMVTFRRTDIIPPDDE